MLSASFLLRFTALQECSNFLTHLVALLYQRKACLIWIGKKIQTCMFPNVSYGEYYGHLHSLEGL